MAQVAQDPQLRERIESYLSYLTEEREALPEIAAEWDEWEDLDQLDFVLEWPIREGRLRQLQQWAAQGVLTPTQRMGYEALLQLVTEHRFLLERLLQDGSLPTARPTGRTLNGHVHTTSSGGMILQSIQAVGAADGTI